MGFKTDKKKKKSIFLYVCSSIFSLHKCIIYKYSNGVYRVTVRYSTQKSVNVSLQDLHKPCFSREKYPSLHRHTFIHVIAFWHSVQLWTTVLKDDLQEEWNFIKSFWQIPWELIENGSHCHWTRLTHTRKKVKHPTSFMALLHLFFMF